MRMPGVKPFRWIKCFDSIAGDPAVLAIARRSSMGGSARIGLDYRALAVMKGNRVVWYWIGGHSEYDRLV